jgi:glycerophosphoryl diester phosphodiesterase
MRVVPFTVNDPEQMRRLIEMGLDGLITDRPATLRGVMQGLGMPVPPADPAPQGKPFFTGTDGL